jgi:replication initiation protein RepC
VIRDDPQGRRYGRRGPDGHIVEAYGFDLSPLAQRYDEFVRIAAAAKVERDRMTKLRRRGTLARRGVAQAADELAVQGHDTEALRQLVRETAELVAAGRACTCSDELVLAVQSLERRRTEAEQMLRELIEPVKTTPMGVENDAHSTNTTLPVNDINHTVIANQASSRPAPTPGLNDPSPAQPNRPASEQLRLTPIQLMELAPALVPYMPAQFADQTWSAIVEAAYWLSGELGINRTLWARACQVMGREYAAVALALVSTRPAGHFTSGPGGYFAGMLRKYEKGELHLDRTLWKLREAKWGKRDQRPVWRQ